MSEYNTLNHCKFLVQYHIIWCPKFRFNVLNGNIEYELKDILHSIADRYDFNKRARNNAGPYPYVCIHKAYRVCHERCPNIQKYFSYYAV